MQYQKINTVRSLANFAAAALSSLVSLPALSVTPRENFENSVQECISYASQINCDKAAGAADLYLEILGKESRCSTYVLIVKTSVVMMPMGLQTKADAAANYRKYLNNKECQSTY